MAIRHGFAKRALAPVASCMLTVQSLRLNDAEAATRWDEFVLQCREATFFHRAGWQRIFAEVFGHSTHYLYAERAGRIEGVLPLAHINSRLFGNRLASLPFAVYGGVATVSPEAASALEAHAQALARSLSVEYLELRNVASRHTDWPSEDIYFTFRKAILPDVEGNMLAIPRKQRAMVRKGMMHGLKSEIDTTADCFYVLYADNMHRHGTPALSPLYFETLQRVFGRDCEILTIRDGAGRALSSVLSFYFRDEVLPYYAGDDVAARGFAANDFKYWELMRRACERGVKWFDYGRSKQGTGPYAFKKNWGFEPLPLHYEYQLYRGGTVPRNNPANPKYRVFIALWRRMPIAFAHRLGPLIVRNLG